MRDASAALRCPSTGNPARSSVQGRGPFSRERAPLQQSRRKHTHHGVHLSHRTRSQHRHLRPHRLGQDHADRAHPLLHRPDPRDSRGPRQGRRRRQDGLDGPGAREGHHHPVRRDLLRVEGHQHQHHRHPGPRRLHHRGGARAARARRRDPRPLLGVRRAVAVDHRRPADAPLQGSAPRLRQQDGPRRRELRPRHGAAQGEAEPPPGDDADADRRRGQVRGHHRPDRGQGLLLRRRQRRERPRGGRSRRARRGGQAGPPRHDRGRRQRRRPPGRAVPRRQARLHRGAEGRHPPRHHRAQDDAGDVRLGLQEQGRAAAARRRPRLPAQPDRGGERGPRPEERTRRRSSSSRTRTSRSSGWPSSSRTAATGSSPTSASTRGTVAKGDFIFNQLEPAEKVQGRRASSACTPTR